ncbi:hypothetical protein BX666DRAFT_1906713 [Dichotomocladium elegans]|nr:hypothetical protein BX666DRAFT_1906713 [Dichotomocladium elegans]
MASSIDTSTFSADSPLSRKRKQEFNKDDRKTSPSAAPVSNNAWSDYVCSTPGTPSVTSSAVIAEVTSATTASGSSIPPSSAAPDEVSLDSNYHNSFAGFDLDLDAIFSSSGASSHFDHTFNFDQYDFESHLPLSGSASRRHSVAVGELDFHSFETVKQEIDMKRFDASLQQLLAVPSAWSTTEDHPDLNNDDSNHIHEKSLTYQQHQQQQPRPTHKRAMSLRLETTHSFQHHASASPDTPSLFTPSFLDALNADEDKNSPLLFPSGPVSFTTALPFTGAENQHQAMTDNLLNMSSSSSSSSTEFLLQQQRQRHQNIMATAGTDTVAPSAISSDIQSMHSWMCGQQQQEQQLSKEESAVKARVDKASRPSPPVSPSNTASSSSSSPPITPMQPASVNTNLNNNYEHFTMPENHYHPTIPEEEDEHVSDHQYQRHNVTAGMSPWPVSLDQQKIRSSRSSLVNARMLQGATTASVLKPHVQEYLMSNDPAGSGEHTVMILTSKVAQKSYGTEKRFLCPPPTTVLSGASWWTSDRTASNSDNSQKVRSGPLAPPGLTIYISGEATSQTGSLEWYGENGDAIDNASSSAATGSSDTKLSGRCVSKHLHINDADEKRKRVEVLVKMQLGNGAQLGTFCSKGIKVISKPSKKRQSLKNMELCIHHGTTISLFNRIRSQTVSTKYLGVSNNVPIQGKGGPSAAPGNGTCFVARTGSWDPFVIWIVDTSRAPKVAAVPRKHHPTNPNYPPPPAIALQQMDTAGQYPLVIHYNQAVVLQCVTTGLVSPVMVIRKIDKGSMVLGGNRLDDLSGTTGGECGDEAIGDPVSQLHKIAFQIVQDPSIAHSNKAGYRPKERVDPSSCSMDEWRLPQTCHPITYLACLNDVVGMHKTTSARTFVAQNTAALQKDVPPPSNWPEHGGGNNKYVVTQDEGKIVRKRRVSCDVASSKLASPPAKLQSGVLAAHRRRVNSLSDVPALTGRRGSISSMADRRGSVDGNSGQVLSDGACWSEDVSDAAVWTIVGTDCATYTFWTPPRLGESGVNALFQSGLGTNESSSPITPFPTVHQASISTGGNDSDNSPFTIIGDNFSRDLSVWFGDIKAPRTEYKSRESISCSLPDLCELLSSPVAVMDEADGKRKLPLLLVRGDGIVYRTGKFYSF